MSRETQEWLENMIRIGDTDARGNAWWYRGADRSDGGSNHYPGAVPVEDVRQLILPWEPVAAPLYIPSADGGYEEVKGFKAITASGKPGHVYATPSGAYAIHGYEEWLLRNVQNLLDDEVHISSAGLLDKGAVAWVELSLSETHTVADFPYRPHLLAFTSVNGRYKTSYGRKVQAVVCDNTLHIASREKGQTVSYKHTKNSAGNIADAREALGLIVATGGEFEAEVNRLLDWKVSSRDFSRFLDLAVPLESVDSKELTQATITRLENKREKLVGMWRGDDRVAPWSGTAFGVLQLTNTFFHHEKGRKTASIRPEQNMLAAISGETEKNDTRTLELLTMATA